MPYRLRIVIIHHDVHSSTPEQLPNCFYTSSTDVLCIIPTLDTDIAYICICVSEYEIHIAEKLKQEKYPLLADYLYLFSMEINC